MATQDRNRPGSPLERIECEVDADARRVFIQYIGLPIDLVAAGAAEPEMVPAGRKGIPRRDSHGDEFRRHRLSGGRMKFWRYITSTGRAFAMPGMDPVRLAAQVAPILWLHQHPEEVHISDAGGNSLTIGTRAALEEHGFGESHYFAPCLDGYYSVTTARSSSKAPRTPTPAMARDPSQPLFRLVVDNTRRPAPIPSPSSAVTSAPETLPLPAGCAPLKRCPHCGCPCDSFAAEVLRDPVLGMGGYAISVDCCGARGPAADSAIEAVQAWNRRMTTLDWRRMVKEAQP